MNKFILISNLVAVFIMPVAAVADNHDEVTIRVLQMDEETPDSVINQIVLPVMEDGSSGDTGMNAIEEKGRVSQGAGRDEAIDVQGFDAEIGIEGMQNEISTQGHGR